jgi:hypothetical protein
MKLSETTLKSSKTLAHKARQSDMTGFFNPLGAA